MKRYVNQYRNYGRLYDVYRAADADDYILVATVMGVGMWDIAMQLTKEEVETLRRSEDAFTDVVMQFVRGRDLLQYRERRIERRIKNLGTDEIALLDEA